MICTIYYDIVCSKMMSFLYLFQADVLSSINIILKLLDEVNKCVKFHERKYMCTGDSPLVFCMLWEKNVLENDIILVAGMSRIAYSALPNGAT